MANYDFKPLSSYDFEILVRDLLQQEFKVTLENFKTGRDGGIDLRYCRDEAGSTIIQCKHYANSSVSALITDLKKKELPKVKKLNPKKYIVVTSLGLSPLNKKEIAELFLPYCESEADIYGCDDLNNLIGKYPEVEKQNFKLWLTSSVVLERIVHSGLYNESEIEIEKVKKRSKYYVQNSSYFKAKEILNKNNYCIIAGLPGIGKTTLAEIILINYLSKGFEVFKISNSFKEALEVYKSSKKQVFYYDDFLGQTTLKEKLNKNEDSQIIEFIQNIKDKGNIKFILTTREYILNQAKATYEKFATSGFDISKCIIDLSDYTKFDRAKILFNHVYFSNLPQEQIEELVMNKNYLKIINHRNYNPRIIESMTTIVNIEKSSFVEEFIKNLDNPTRIWSHIFEFQLSQPSKNLLIIMLFLPEEILLEDLEKAFWKILRFKNIHYGIQISERDFSLSLKELEGNFITTKKYDKDYVISFSNPSVRDFMENYISSHPSEIEGICNNFIYFQQLIELYNLVKKKKIFKYVKSFYYKNLVENFCSQSVLIAKIYGFPVKVYKQPESLDGRLTFILNLLDENNDSELKDLIPGLIAKTFDTRNLDTRNSFRIKKQNCITLLQRITETEFKDVVLQDIIQLNLKAYFMKDVDELGFEEIINLQELFPELITKYELDEIRNQFILRYKNLIDYIIEEDDADYMLEYFDYFVQLGKFFSIDIDEELERLNEKINDLNQSDYEPDEDDDLRYDSKFSNDTDIDENLIESMFDSLKECKDM